MHPKINIFCLDLFYMPPSPLKVLIIESECSERSYLAWNPTFPCQTMQTAVRPAVASAVAAPSSAVFAAFAGASSVPVAGGTGLQPVVTGVCMAGQGNKEGLKLHNFAHSLTREGMPQTLQQARGSIHAPNLIRLKKPIVLGSWGIFGLCTCSLLAEIYQESQAKTDKYPQEVPIKARSRTVGPGRPRTLPHPSPQSANEIQQSGPPNENVSKEQWPVGTIEARVVHQGGWAMSD